MLSSKIKRLRIRNGWSQEFLAEKLNVSRQTIYKWESGISQPNAHHIISLIIMFNISNDELQHFYKNSSDL